MLQRAARAQDNGPPHTASSRGGVPSKKALGLLLGRTVPDPSAKLDTRKNSYTAARPNEPHLPKTSGTSAAPLRGGRREESPRTHLGRRPRPRLHQDHTSWKPRDHGAPFYNCSHYCELNSGPCAIKRKAPMCQAPALTGCKHRTISIVYVSKDSHIKRKDLRFNRTH